MARVRVRECGPGAVAQPAQALFLGRGQGLGEQEPAALARGIAGQQDAAEFEPGAGGDGPGPEAVRRRQSVLQVRRASGPVAARPR
ncbi:hypothetical protein O1L60_37055 [Streptomyces diastatochromogenes]|nr:hypothetical protein [Streptomyces diastatochromogenes]